jgi:hypothetical protein
MIVVSDASPIISLALIDRLDLLEQLYGKILIAPAVYAEIVVPGDPQHSHLGSLKWLETKSIFNPIVIALLLREIDLGEAESIALALEAKSDLLLLDDRKARSIAVYLGLPMAGLLDILSEAKQAQLIPAIKPVLDDLIARAKFRVSKKLYQRVLTSAGEMPDAQSA